MTGTLVGFRSNGTVIAQFKMGKEQGDNMVTQLSSSLIAAWYNEDGMMMRMGGQNCHLVVPTRLSEVNAGLTV
jgi:hypothetical protein